MVTCPQVSLQLLSHTPTLKQLTVIMNKSIISTIAHKIKKSFKKIKQLNKQKIIKENQFNEEYRDIIEENLYNERLERALSHLIANTPSCVPQKMTFDVEDGVCISFYSGCQVAQAQSS